MELLAVRNVWKRYGDEGAPWVLRGVNLEVGVGEEVFLLGSNGSGKTTLLRIIAGLTLPSRGEVRVAGREPRDPEARAIMGVVLHHSLLYPTLTVEENLAFYASLYGVEDYDPSADWVVESLGLRGRLRDRVSTLSFGWRRRADIARALLHRPRLLLLDEPFTGLDSKGVEDLYNVLKSYVGEGGSLVATAPKESDIGPVEEARVAVLRGGRLEWAG